MTDVRSCIVTIAIAFTCGVLVAQEGPPSEWNGPVALAQWKPVGRPAGSAPRDAAGLVLAVNPADGPNTLRSPRLNVAARSVYGVRITYIAQLASSAPPEFLVGWLDNIHHIDDMERCAIVVPVKIGQTDTITVDFRTSSCWRSDALLNQIDLNFDGRRGDPHGTVYVRAIELLRR